MCSEVLKSGHAGLREQQNPEGIGTSLIITGPVLLMRAGSRSVELLSGVHIRSALLGSRPSTSWNIFMNLNLRVLAFGLVESWTGSVRSGRDGGV